MRELLILKFAYIFNVPATPYLDDLAVTDIILIQSAQLWQIMWNYMIKVGKMSIQIVS